VACRPIGAYRKRPADCVSRRTVPFASCGSSIITPHLDGRGTGGTIPRLLTSDEYPGYKVAIQQEYGLRVVPLTVLPKPKGRPRIEKKVVPTTRPRWQTSADNPRDVGRPQRSPVDHA
jgi:hypothetical protein